MSANIFSTPSTKLNYILNEVSGNVLSIILCAADDCMDQVQQYSNKEKFLIFSAQPLVLAHIAEGLELMRVPHLSYRSTIPAKVCKSNLLSFETSILYRVLLMELKYGARGL